MLFSSFSTSVVVNFPLTKDDRKWRDNIVKTILSGQNLQSASRKSVPYIFEL